VDVIKVRAATTADADRLVASMDGSFSIAVNGSNSSTEVELRADNASAVKLVELFDALGQWLREAGLNACHIGFGERSYTLLAAANGEQNDPAAFLLERTIQLQTALDSRVVIEQAKGILAERESITPEEAFAVLRRQARRRRMKLHDLAAGVVATVSHPAARRI
jgi:ANTAR domain